jgi:predicted HTH domain antitoxin
MKTSNGETLLERELEATVEAGLFRSKREALQEALSTWLAVKPSRRLEAAIQMFKSGEVSLSRAAEIAGVTRWQLQDILAERGIMQEVEVESAEELEEQVALIRRLRGDAAG